MSRTGQVRFELEQFEVIDGDRCEVIGCWLGVRGRRFLRPVLTVTVDGRSKRLLADLAGKPWDAEEGGTWHASFPCPPAGTELVGVELSVAPDLTVALQSRRPTSSESPAVPDLAAPRPAPHTSDEANAPATPSPFERRSRVDAGERLRRELVDARTEQRRLQSKVDHLRLEKTDTAQQVRELIGQAGEVKEELDAVTRAREQLAVELQRERAKLEGVGAERDEALFQLDVMTAKRDAARHDYTEIVRQLKAREAADQQTLADRDRASAERDAVSVAPDAAIAKSAQLSRRTTAPRPSTRSYALSFRPARAAVVLLVITLLVTLIVLRP